MVSCLSRRTSRRWNLTLFDHSDCCCSVVRLSWPFNSFPWFIFVRLLISWWKFLTSVRWNLTQLSLVPGVDRWENLSLCRYRIVRHKRFWTSWYPNRIDEEIVQDIPRIYIWLKRKLVVDALVPILDRWKNMIKLLWCKSRQKICEMELNIVSNCSMEYVSMGALNVLPDTLYNLFCWHSYPTWDWNRHLIHLLSLSLN